MILRITRHTVITEEMVETSIVDLTLRDGTHVIVDLAYIQEILERREYDDYIA